MRKAKAIKKVKTRDEIMATLTEVDRIGNKTLGYLKSNPKVHADISDWLWTLCGKVIEVTETPTRSHNFNYNYFDYPEEGDERVDVPVVYFMEEWLEDVKEEPVLTEE